MLTCAAGFVPAEFVSMGHFLPLNYNTLNGDDFDRRVRAPARGAPATVAELGALVTAARNAGHGVYPVGGRTMLDVGLPPAKPGVAVDTTALDQVIDYPARDMTITVQAGITVAALQRELASRGPAAAGGRAARRSGRRSAGRSRSTRAARAATGTARCATTSSASAS